METITPATQSVGATILKQLGWNKFIAMTGAKNFVFDNNGLYFKLPATITRDRINYIRITLNVMDTYDIEFWALGRFAKKLDEINGIYNDGLKAVIADRTGLRLSL